MHKPPNFTPRHYMFGNNAQGYPFKSAFPLLRSIRFLALAILAVAYPKH